MKTLAFDQATNVSAWSLFDGDELITYGIIDLSKERDMLVRLPLMDKELCAVIDQAKPDIVILEDVSYQSNAKALIELARLQGRIMHACEVRHIPYRVYKPTSWRKEVGIDQSKKKRTELKKMACEFVKTKYGIDDIKDDVAEAICIGLCYVLKKSKE